MSELLAELAVCCDRRLPAVVSAESLEAWSCGTWRSLASAGLLIEAAPANWSFCRECDEPTVQPIVYVQDDAGCTRPYLSCPNCGPQQLAPLEVEAWRVDWEQWLREIARALQARGEMRPIVADVLWQLGRLPSATGHWHGFVARGLHRRGAAAALREVQWPQKTLLLVARSISTANFALPDTSRVVALGDLFDWENERLVCQQSLLDDSLAARPAAAPVKRRSKRAERAHDIGSLTNVLIEHWRAARDFAQAALDHGREPRLLPRPTQRQLARAAEISEVRVSRCLRDSAARELRLLWDGALDLESVLRRGARVQR